MKTLLRYVAQLALYVPLMALIGTFSTQPRLEVLAPDEALLRLSFIHAAERKAPCRTRTPEELARLAPNMRAAQDCPRERAPVLVELEVDGEIVLRREVQPAGLKNDGNAALYHRLRLPAGEHRVVARLRDRPAGDFNFHADERVRLRPGQVLLIDFVAAKGGFLFRL